MNTVNKDTMLVRISDKDQIKIDRIEQKEFKSLLPKILLFILCGLILSGVIAHYLNIHLMAVIIGLTFGLACLKSIFVVIRGPSKQNDMDPKIREVYLRSGWDGKSPFIVK